jgi:hypothetical protein
MSLQTVQPMQWYERNFSAEAWNPSVTRAKLGLSLDVLSVVWRGWRLSAARRWGPTLSGLLHSKMSEAPRFCPFHPDFHLILFTTTILFVHSLICLVILSS